MIVCQVASPATVSRCGMIYMEPTGLGWTPILDSWLQSLPRTITSSQLDKMRQTALWLIPPLDAYTRRCCVEPVETQIGMLLRSFTDQMGSMLDVFHDQSKFASLKPSHADQILEGNTLFALVWAFGSSTTGDTRDNWSVFMRELVARSPHSDPSAHSPLILNSSLADPIKLDKPFPDSGTVFDYMFDSVGLKWVDWLKSVPTYTVPAGAQFHEVVVPTVDKLRYSFWLRTLILHNKAVLFTGPTGTGKSIYIKEMLSSGLGAAFTYISMAMSAQTEAEQMQSIIDSKMDRRRKGVYGPPFGKTMVLFIDDLNMPKVETYGAQPPIELLRQMVDQNGWYDVATAEKAFRVLENVQVVHAMGFPGGGKNEITLRYTAHMNMFAFTTLSKESMHRVFGTVMQHFLDAGQFAGMVSKLKDSIVSATIAVYDTISNELLPTPSKSHYTFNLRDLGKVIQGVLQIKAEHCNRQDKMIRLWIHESLRVFHDRLTDQADRQWFHSLIGLTVETHFKGTNFNTLLSCCESDPDLVASQGLRRLMFGGWGGDDNKDKHYVEIQVYGSEERVRTEMSAVLAEYNTVSKTPMNIVLFQFAIEHLSRICRLIKQPYGNALLVGVGGSGRQSLTRLSAFICEAALFQVEISKSYGVTEWHESLRELLTSAGGAKAEPVVFLFSDTQIKDPLFMEDINNLLNSGEVPNLFSPEEKIALLEDLRRPAKEAGVDSSPNSLFSFFVQRCRANLHMVLALSPIGDKFRGMLRMFPSLVNCCTIDWFAEWPADALHSVAKEFLADLDCEANTLNNVMEMCIEFHTEVQRTAARYLEEAGRSYYVTPTSYLELIQSYLSLLGNKQREVAEQRDRYGNGHTKLIETEEKVAVMKSELQALQPQIVVAQRDTAELLERITVDEKAANETRVVVERDQAATAKQAGAAKELADSCEADLALAIPALNKATKALNSIKKPEIVEIKSMQKPPANVKMVLSAVMVMLDEKAVVVQKEGGKPGEKMKDYWPAAQRALADAHFIDRLLEFDKDDIPDEIITKVRKDFIALDNFQPHIVRNSSQAAEGMCTWVCAMDVYERVEKTVRPKKAALAQSKEELHELETALGLKISQLQEVEAKIASLNEQLSEATAKKEHLEAEAITCEQKLDRANKLITGLGGEKARWSHQSHRYANDYKNLIGDLLIGSGIVAYLGAFTLEFRSDVIRRWTAELVNKQIACSDSFSLVKTLGDPIEIREWQLCGLPKDDFSTENGIVVKMARRWPLCIDPQGQAAKYIRNKEQANQLSITRLSDPNFMRVLETNVTYGNPVLLENVGEEIDPSLEPLLLKQIFKASGVPCIRIGDAVLEYNPGFQLYLTTKLSNPHYLPEVSTKVALINFMITPEGLRDQLLGQVVAHERSDLEEKKNALLLESAVNARKLKECEGQILNVLAAASDILEDEEGVKVLGEAKDISDDVTRKQVAADKVIATINIARDGYSPAAEVASVLYFSVNSLQHIDPMYQYSLQWFISLFHRALRESPKPKDPKDVPARLQLLSAHFKFAIYRNVCMSLFVAHKLVFSLTMCVALMSHIDHAIDQSEWRFLLTGIGASLQSPPPNPDPEWIASKLWTQICALSSFPRFKGLSDLATIHAEELRAIFDHSEPHKCQWPGNLSKFGPGDFGHLLLIRTVRPDKLIPSVVAFVSANLGAGFTEPPPFQLQDCHADSSCCTPLIFVLCPGQDPMSQMRSLAQSKGVCGNKLMTVSLGQGQDKKAEAFVADGVETGGWVVLQNCHLYVSWMPKLEKICEDLDPDNVHQQFRLWLTSAPSTAFPVSILQNGIKMINEPPKGLRANLLASYLTDPIADPEFFNNSAQPHAFMKLLFGLCFFHAVVQERRAFGALGWNIPYEFNESDLRICARQLRIFLDESDAVPYKALSYLAGECNYGGRVTETWDRRALSTVLDDYYSPLLLDDTHRFDDPQYYAPADGEYKEYLSFIQSLPTDQTPAIFGMDQNANMTRDTKETLRLCEDTLKTQGGGAQSSGGLNRDSVIAELAKGILAGLPAQFDVEEVLLEYPTLYEDSMNSVLVQEMIRYNRLTSVVRSSLLQLLKAIKGLVVMDAKLEEVACAFFDGRVPQLWLDSSFSSLKPLGGYAADLLARLAMFESWYRNGPPAVFWFSGLYFPHAFLTGTLQNYARRNKIAIDTVDFDFLCLRDCPDTACDKGVYIDGLYIEGARWDTESWQLAEQLPKVLLEPMPVIQLETLTCDEIRARHGQDVLKNGEPHYQCPVYKTSVRRGVLATTGHSTNYVLPIRLVSSKPQKYWIKRGTALLCATDD